MKKLSVISLALNEEKSLPELHEELIPVLESLGIDWEWIIIDDHSADSTPDVIKRFAQSDSRIRGLRMAKTEGATALCFLGMQKASGDCAVMLAADGQDPPKYIPRLIDEMKKGEYKVVWLTREGGRGDPFFKRQVARFYYFVMRRIIGISSIPPSGSDMVLIDGAVVKEMSKIRGKNLNNLVTIAELGFSQSSVPGKRRPRVHGKSKFTFAKSFNMMFDTITAHSVMPLRAMTFLGFSTAFLGFLYGVNVLIAKINGGLVEGWASLILVVLVVGGVQMIMLGVIGEYLWRTLENTRGSSGLIIESEIGEWEN